MTIFRAFQLALGWSLLHFLWQGAIIGVGFAGALAATRNAAPVLRYRIACVTLLLMVLAFLGTAAASLDQSLHSSGAQAPIFAATRGSASSSHTASSIAPLFRTRILPAIGSHLLLVEVLWLAGLVWIAARVGFAYRTVHRLRAQATPPELIALHEASERITLTLGLHDQPHILISNAIDTPVVIGCWRPAVLLPATLFPSLSRAQAEAVLAHECAHLARRDPQVNALQLVVEALLFFHPAVWWASRCIRREREYCCDDLAVLACGEPLPYAKALATLEEGRTILQPQFFPGIATGDLSMRIHRLFDPRKAIATTTSTRAAIAAGAVITASCLAFLSHSAVAQVQAATAATAASNSAAPAEKPNMDCGYYPKDNVMQDGECVVTHEPDGPFFCASLGDPTQKQHQLACGWKVKRYLDWEARQHSNDTKQ